MDENEKVSEKTDTSSAARLNEKTFQLPCGKSCTVRRAKGKDNMDASDIALLTYGKQPSSMQVMNCIMSLVTKIDGAGIDTKDLEDMWSEDYTAIQMAYMEISGGL